MPGSGCPPAALPSVETRDSKYAGDDRRARESRARKGAAHCFGRASPKPSPTATAMPTSQLPTLEFVLRNYKNFNAGDPRCVARLPSTHRRGGQDVLGGGGGHVVGTARNHARSRHPGRPDPWALGDRGQPRRVSLSAGRSRTGTRTSPSIATSPSKTIRGFSINGCDG